MSKAYEIIANQMIGLVTKATESGERLPWNKPWDPFRKDYLADDHSVHGRFYSGINGMTTRLVRQIRGYKSRVWLTYKQVQDGGGKLKDAKGHGIYVMGWFKPTRKEKDSAGNEVEKELGYLAPRAWVVFNGDLVEGMKLPEFKNKTILRAIDTTTADELLKNMPKAPTVVYEEQRAYYRPATDTINMPKPETFKSAEFFLSVLAHEAVHSTGHESRLNRATVTKAGVFGSYEYSREELIAEMGAAMICGRLGIENEAMQTSSASYLQGWLKALQNDPKMLTMAASQAEKAARYILNEQEEKELEAAA